MTFVHDDPEFPALLRIVARNRGLSPALVEKDYWVTHSLWVLLEVGLEVWFKGGTSLSKGFGLIERFSEDLDLKIEPGATSVPPVANWKSKNPGQVRARQAFFRGLADAVRVPGAVVRLDPLDDDPREGVYRVEYPGHFLRDLPPPMLPFVKLEVGNARVTPFVLRTLSSFVHDALTAQGMAQEYEDNRPRDVRCVHPRVTLLEKLNALSGGWRRTREPADFVRHYEDVARIAEHFDGLPPLAQSVRDMVEEMLREGQIAQRPDVDDPAWMLPPGAETDGVRQAYEAIAAMYWGPRLSLDGAAEAIRNWIRQWLS